MSEALAMECVVTLGRKGGISISLTGEDLDPWNALGLSLGL